MSMAAEGGVKSKSPKLGSLGCRPGPPDVGWVSVGEDEGGRAPDFPGLRVKGSNLEPGV